jgi:hypothetical protein
VLTPSVALQVIQIVFCPLSTMQVWRVRSGAAHRCMAS